MDDLQVSDSFAEVQRSLLPFVRSRQEVLRIRRLLSSHVCTHLSQELGYPIHGKPLALLNEQNEANITPGGSRGLRKEYLKTLRANVKARQEYEKLSNQLKSTELNAQDSGALVDFVSLVRLRQRYERLRILENHTSTLVRKSSPALSSTDQASRRPRIPKCLLEENDSDNPSPSSPDLKQLLQNLERAILLARSQLKEEQLILARVKEKGSTFGSETSDPTQMNNNVLQALAETRNELISWVENELSKTGEPSPLTAHDDEASSQGVDSAESIENYLFNIQNQYKSYLQARKVAIEAVCRAETQQPLLQTKASFELTETKPSSHQISPGTRVMAPFLQDLTLLSNEQKAILQHRSHMTITLAKQHKDTIHIFDRLAEESHLLPTYPMARSKSIGRVLGQSASMGDEIGSKETPSAFHLAQAWTAASEAASKATKDSVLESVDEGVSSLEDSRKTISMINDLLGKGKLGARLLSREGDGGDDGDDLWIPETASRDLTINAEAQGGIPSNSHSIWDALDGNLGVI